MEEEKLQNDTLVKEKKDFHPIWIYIVCRFGFAILLSVIIGVVLGVKVAVNKESVDIVIQDSKNTISFILTIITNLLIFLVFAIMYHKKLKVDIKRLTKENLKDTMLFALLALVLDIILSTILVKFNLVLDNQNTLNSLIKIYPIPIIILIILIGPFIEEIVFRYSLGSLIKNKVIFITVSAVIFGAMHGLGIATLLYILIGALFAHIYLKTDKNLVASILAHVTLNTGAVILMLISLF